MTRETALRVIRFLNDIHVKGGRWDEADMRLYKGAADVIRKGATV